jgi:hypothetical protein
MYYLCREIKHMNIISSYLCTSDGVDVLIAYRLCFEIARQYRLSTELYWQCDLASHFKTEPIETVSFSFGISENTVFSNAIDSVSFGRWTGYWWLWSRPTYPTVVGSIPLDPLVRFFNPIVNPYCWLNTLYTIIIVITTLSLHNFLPLWMNYLFICRCSLA